jgi:hypothetical protein
MLTQLVITSFSVISQKQAKPTRLYPLMAGFLIFNPKGGVHPSFTIRASSLIVIGKRDSTTQALGGVKESRHSIVRMRTRQNLQPLL